MPVRRKGVAATRLGLVFLRRSSPGGRPHSLQPRPGVLRSRQWETGRGAGRKRKPARGEGWAACPPLLFLCLEAFSCRLQASGRLGCHPWVSGSKICSSRGLLLWALIRFYTTAKQSYNPLKRSLPPCYKTSSGIYTVQ